jgi:hypothetical protein
MPQSLQLLHHAQATAEEEDATTVMTLEQLDLGFGSTQHTNLTASAA